MNPLDMEEVDVSDAFPDRPAWFAPETYQDDLPRASWAPVDLASILDGTAPAVVPTLMERTDGVRLLYPGLVHSVAGESESGKSMLMLAVAAEVLTTGGRVLYLDYESDPQTVLDRLTKLGAPREALAERLDYVRPEADPVEGGADECAAFRDRLRTRYALAVLDGVTEALSVSGLSSNDNDEVTGWIRRVPRCIARGTGAAVVMVDHVTKSTDGRGRFAIGAQAKLAALDGAQYVVEPLAALGVGMAGKLAVRVGKDRPGRVRPHGSTWRKSDRTQAVAVALFDSTDPERIAYTLEPPARELDPDEAHAEMDAAREREVLAWITDRPAAPTFNQIVKAVQGRREAVREAVDRLVADGRVRTRPGPRGATLHEPAELAVLPTGTGSRSKDRDREPVTGTSPHLTGISGNQWEPVTTERDDR